MSLHSTLDCYFDNPFRLEANFFPSTLLGERIVVPTTALDELWNTPETILNKNRAYDQVSSCLDVRKKNFEAMLIASREFSGNILDSHLGIRF